MTATSDSARCAECATTCVAGYRMERASGLAILCLRCALRQRPLILRSFRIALVVGTILTTINQGELIISGAWPTALAWKIPLTYTVPFVVAMWGALTSARRRTQH